MVVVVMMLTQRGCQGAGRSDSRVDAEAGGPMSRSGIPPVEDYHDDDCDDHDAYDDNDDGDDDDDLHVIEQVQLEPLVPVKVEAPTSHNRPRFVYMVNLNIFLHTYFIYRFLFHKYIKSLQKIFQNFAQSFYVLAMCVMFKLKNILITNTIISHLNHAKEIKYVPNTKTQCKYKYQIQTDHIPPQSRSRDL